MTQRSNGPLVNSQYEHSGVEPVVVLGAEYVVFMEVGGWEEDGPGDFGVHDDAISVEPPSKYRQRHTQILVRKVILHYPVCPFSCRLCQFDHYERLQVSRLVEVRVVLIQRMAKHMRRNSPSITMPPMCLDTPLVDTPEFVLVPLVQHGCLAYPGPLIAGVKVIRTVLEARMSAQWLRWRRGRICERCGAFACEAEEVDEDKGRDSDEEERSTAHRHSLLHGKRARAMQDQMVCRRSYTDMMRSKADVIAIEQKTPWNLMPGDDI